MRVLLHTIDNIPQEVNYNLTSHVLESDHVNPELFHLFHCWKCGKQLFQFSGNVVQSVPGPIFSPLPFIQFCKHCKQRHLINSIL